MIFCTIVQNLSFVCNNGIIFLGIDGELETLKGHNIYPTYSEIILGKKRHIEKNKTLGSYWSIQQYLSIQFRLLREDFVTVLRSGIEEYRSGGNQIDKICVHTNIRLKKVETKHRRLKKNLYSIKNIRKGDKEFMHGSLLIFTKDQFATITMAKVKQLDEDDLMPNEKRDVFLVFLPDSKSIIEEDIENTNYLMIECLEYFEPYYQVLLVLKNMSTKEKPTLPMEKYILKVETTSEPPKYLKNCEYIIDQHKVSPLKWPHNLNCFNLNKAQMCAFRAAITQEFSVIQGPPGTGKTYLGVKIAQTLIENRQFWYNNSPMLVISHKNHAIDQFLEGLIGCTNALIRVGRRSKSELLKEYNLQVLRDQYNNNSKCEVLKIVEDKECFRGIVDLFSTTLATTSLNGSWFKSAKTKDIILWLFGRERNGSTHNGVSFISTLCFCLIDRRAYFSL